MPRPASPLGARPVAAFAIALVAVLTVLAAPADAAPAAMPTRFVLEGAPYSHGAFSVDRTRSYVLLVHAKHRPRYVNATPVPGRPAGGYYPFTKTGRHTWSFRLRIDRAMKSHRYWNLGVMTGHTLHRLRVRVLGHHQKPHKVGSGPHQG